MKSFISTFKRMRVLCLQMPVVPGEVGTNLSYVRSQLAKLRPGMVDLVCLPEMWTTDHLPEHSVRLADETEEALREVNAEARRLGCLIVGSALERDAMRHHLFYNCAHVLSPNERLGKRFPQWGRSLRVMAKYRKIHLFRPLKEQLLFRGGKDLQLVETPWARVGLAICYDLRFPEMFRALCRRGAQVIVVPSAWPAQRSIHWQVLLRARAIENQVFVMGVNRVGPSRRGFMFAGRSMIVDPWGEVLFEGVAKPERVNLLHLKKAIITLHGHNLNVTRQRITVARDARRDLYRKWLG